MFFHTGFSKFIFFFFKTIIHGKQRNFIPAYCRWLYALNSLWRKHVLHCSDSVLDENFKRLSTDQDLGIITFGGRIRHRTLSLFFADISSLKKSCAASSKHPFSASASFWYRLLPLSSCRGIYSFICLLCPCMFTAKKRHKQLKSDICL